MPDVDERYQEIDRAARALAALITKEVPQGWSWGIFLVPALGERAVFWISNAERAGMLDAVRGWVDDQDRRAAEATRVPPGRSMGVQCPDCGTIAFAGPLAPEYAGAVWVCSGCHTPIPRTRWIAVRTATKVRGL